MADEYIRKSDLVDFMRKHISDGIYLDHFIMSLAFIKTVDHMEAKHSEWLPINRDKQSMAQLFDTNWRCAACFRESIIAFNYCPYCGCKMFKEEDDAE